MTQPKETKQLSKRLSGKECLRRNELIELIDSKYRDFLDCAIALVELRDSRLYRDTHDTFDKFCEERWDLSRRHVDRMIASADVAISMTQPPENERQLRELTSVPEEDRDDVMEEARQVAKKDDRTVTAKDIVKVVKDKKKKVKEDSGAKPDLGGAAEAMSCVQKFNGFNQSLASFLKKYDELADSAGGAYLRDRGTILMKQRFAAAIKEAQAVIASAKPHAFCPRCEATGMMGTIVCAVCEGNGYVTKQGG